MLVTRVEIEAPTASFRYPHFLVGRQPTYQMPPLSTLYGHLCSAVGEWVDPTGLSFGVWFRFEARLDDLEHQTIVARSGGYLPGTKESKVLEGAVVPVRREFLYGVTMALYVSGDWSHAFRSPRYVVVLGRSQDLASYRRIEAIELQEDAECYYENTLLPWELRPHILRASAETMPRWVDYAHGRQPRFDRFLVVRDAIFTNSPSDVIRAGERRACLVDPRSPEKRGLRRGVWMHSLVGAAP